jgi:hypothetical protein
MNTMRFLSFQIDIREGYNMSTEVSGYALQKCWLCPNKRYETYIDAQLIHTMVYEISDRRPY